MSPACARGINQRHGAPQAPAPKSGAARAAPLSGRRVSASASSGARAQRTDEQRIVVVVAASAGKQEGKADKAVQLKSISVSRFPQTALHLPNPIVAQPAAWCAARTRASASVTRARARSAPRTAHISKRASRSLARAQNAKQQIARAQPRLLGVMETTDSEASEVPGGQVSGASISEFQNALIFGEQLSFVRRTPSKS